MVINSRIEVRLPAFHHACYHLRLRTVKYDGCMFINKVHDFPSFSHKRHSIEALHFGKSRRRMGVTLLSRFETKRPVLFPSCHPWPYTLTLRHRVLDVWTRIICAFGTLLTIQEVESSTLYIAPSTCPSKPCKHSSGKSPV